VPEVNSGGISPQAVEANLGPPEIC